MSVAVRRRFEFDRDSFAFPNELVWEYHFDPAPAAPSVRRRVPAPRYAHHCFVLVRAARRSTTTRASTPPPATRTTRAIGG